jgi:MFS family permease
VSLIAIGVWSYYHAVHNLALDPWLVTLLYVVGGVMGMLGIPIGARLANGWGRRPTLLLGVCVGVAAGIAYFWVPADRGIATFALLAAAFGVFNLGTQAQGVAERCIETELFPTHLRATYAGWRSLAEAVARIVSQFSLAGLVHAFGDFSLAVSVLCLATLLPSLVVFLASVPETRGLGLASDSVP